MEVNEQQKYSKLEIDALEVNNADHDELNDEEVDDAAADELLPISNNDSLIHRCGTFVCCGNDINSAWIPWLFGWGVQRFQEFSHSFTEITFIFFLLWYCYLNGNNNVAWMSAVFALLVAIFVFSASILWFLGATSAYEGRCDVMKKRFGFAPYSLNHEDDFCHPPSVALSCLLVGLLYLWLSGCMVYQSYIIYRDRDWNARIVEEQTRRQWFRREGGRRLDSLSRYSGDPLSSAAIHEDVEITESLLGQPCDDVESTEGSLGQP